MIQEGGESTESHLGSPVHPVSEAQGTGVSEVVPSTPGTAAAAAAAGWPLFT